MVRDRDVRRHGEHRTKRVILEIYDELAAAAADGCRYATRLSPPPADDACRHAPRAAARSPHLRG